MDFPEDELEKEELQENESMPASGNVPENPEPTDDELLKDSEPEENSSLGHTKFHGMVDAVKGVANSNLAKFLLAHGWIIPLILFIIVALVVIVHFQMDFDLFGIGKPKVTYYADTPSCGKVYLTWENPSYTEARQKVEPDYVPISDPSLVNLEEEDQYGVRYTYKPYEYDTYIAGIVWNDNYNAMDVDNAIVYEAMAIASRSRLLAELPDNCVVLKNYNEQASHFKELDGSEEKYTDIVSAVAASQGMIIIKNNEILPAMYDAFLYNKKREEEDASRNRVYFYHMAHKNNEESLKIHAKWVDDIEKAKGKVLPKVQTFEIKKMTSLSLYGARYLLEREDANYELYRILKYFYGQDIKFYTIDSSANFGGNLIAIGGTNCMWWPIGSNETFVKDGILYASGAPAATRITSPFGYRGPVEGVPDATRYHKSIDIGGGQEGGTNINIIAVADGEVTRISSGTTLGNGVFITHENGMVTRYGHMSRIDVSVGQVVKQGQVIGKMGSTGASSAVHLDFQIQDHGTAVNPLNYVSNINPRPINCGLTPPTETLVPSGTGDGKESICIGFLNAGYSPEQTAGVMINAYDESRFDSNAFNPAGGGIGAYGLFQWRSGRQSSLKALKNYNTPDVQVAFALSELNSSESNAKKHLLASSNAGISAFNFCKYYERPGSDSYCQSRQNNSLVNEYYNYARNGCK